MLLLTASITLGQIRSTLVNTKTHRTAFNLQNVSIYCPFVCSGIPYVACGIIPESFGFPIRPTSYLLAQYFGNSRPYQIKVGAYV